MALRLREDLLALMRHAHLLQQTMLERIYFQLVPKKGLIKKLTPHMMMMTLILFAQLLIFRA